MMKTYVLAMLMAVSLASCTKGTVKNSDLVMPNPQLLGCNSSRFQQIWRADYPAADAVYPKQLSFDFKGNCTYGVTAKYDKFTSSDNIRKVIDKDYGQWAMSHSDPSPLMMWRVEPEKFVIQLGTADDGMKQLIYLSLKPELR